MLSVRSRYSLPHFPLGFRTGLLSLCAVLFFGSSVFAQHQLPYLDGSRNSPLGQVDFDEIYREQMLLDSMQKDRGSAQSQQFESGTVSALDMVAPKKAVAKLREATSLLVAQKAKDAVSYLQKAIEIYPKFVSAHLELGLAYYDLKDKRAKDEFETATMLDDQLPISHLYLGVLSLWSNDFNTADASLEKAALLSPNDPQILNALVFAQNGVHKYSDVLRTVDHIHKLDHHGMGEVHYVAAAAALSMHNIQSGISELNTFLSEEPAGPLSPVAREKLEQLSHFRAPAAQSGDPTTMQAVPLSVAQSTFPNTPRLASELKAATDAIDTSDDPEESDEPQMANVTSSPALDDKPPFANSTTGFTIRQAVDETALFLAVSEHGKMISDLSASDIQIRDDNRPPDRVLQFLPQSKLPLRLGVLIDISGSVEHRINFEKHAAKKFLEKVLNPASDLAFVAGFDEDLHVTQDFSNDAVALRNAVDRIARQADATSVFDAIHSACWKLAAYPDQGRIARVLVVLTDGQDNASHRSLKQAMDAAENAGVTIYAFNTSEDYDMQTDANQVLRMIADGTGGEAKYPRNMSDLDRYFNQLSEVIRSRYLIAYKPAGFIPDGSFRKLRVTATKDGRTLQVHVRKGYYARLAQTTENREAVGTN